MCFLFQRPEYSSFPSINLSPRSSFIPIPLPIDLQHIPNLQSPSPQHPRPLILRHIRRRTPLLIRNLLLLQPHNRILPHLLRSSLAVYFHNRPPGC